ncbi:response regulator [Tepidamorphus sp. 3E244]|uniref:response regulator n=1 Tax=Tepidamorphus sp. 3E244 TaxID=3385498 RepID=UPI0038FCA331
MKQLEKITYVEDDRDIRALAEIVLSDIAGFTVHVCESGEMAVAGAADFGPDMIILDVMMPGMDGLETFRRLREFDSLKHTPVVFMTAKAQTQEVEQYLGMGAVDVIVKPFDPSTLPDRINGIWNSLKSEAAE